MTDTRDELLPCPFCGSEPRIVDDYGYEHCQIFCVDCEIEPCVWRPAGKFKEAIAVWNRRAADAVPAAVPGDVGDVGELVEGLLTRRWLQGADQKNATLLDDGEPWLGDKAAADTITALSARCGELERERDEARAMYHAACDERESLKKIRVAAEARCGELERERNEGILTFAEAILHGDDEHRAWLRAAAAAFIAGGKLPPPSGLGAAEARVAELERLVQDMLDHDPNDMAADAITVLDVWRKEARAAITKGDDDAAEREACAKVNDAAAQRRENLLMITKREVTRRRLISEIERLQDAAAAIRVRGEKP